MLISSAGYHDRKVSGMAKNLWLQDKKNFNKETPVSIKRLIHVEQIRNLHNLICFVQDVTHCNLNMLYRSDDKPSSAGRHSDQVGSIVILYRSYTVRRYIGKSILRVYFIATHIRNSLPSSFQNHQKIKYSWSHIKAHNKNTWT